MVYTINNTHIFDYVGKKGIIIRADVLSPDDYLPSVLIGRDIQIQELAYLMKPLFLRGAPNNALIFGSPGCGKTATSKYVLRALMDKLEHDPIDIKVDWICISCKEVYTTNAVLFKLIEYLDPKTKVKRSGYSMDYYYEILYFLINEKNTALIVILDEIDFLKSDDILYSFSRAISNGKFTGRQFIRIIGLSNSLKFEAKLDPRVLSSVGFEKFRFPSYNTDDIYHILNDRIDLAFTSNSIDEETIIECAKNSAKTGGDIRKALNVLHTAAKMAEGEGSEKITVLHIKKADEKVQNDDIISSVVTLPLHHKIVLLSVIKLMNNKKQSNTGDVTSMYETLCKIIAEKPSSRPTVSGWISSLDMQGYIQSVAVNNCGKTRIISIPHECIQPTKKALYSDYQLEGLKEYFPLAGEINAI